MVSISFEKITLPNDAKMTERLDHDYAQSSMSRSQARTDSTGRAAIDADICFINIFRGNTLQTTTRQQKMDKRYSLHNILPS